MKKIDLKNVKYEMNDRIYVDMTNKNKSIDDLYALSSVIAAMAIGGHKSDLLKEDFKPARVVIHAGTAVYVQLQNGDFAFFYEGSCKPVLSQFKPLVIKEIQVKLNTTKDKAAKLSLLYNNILKSYLVLFTLLCVFLWWKA